MGKRHERLGHDLSRCPECEATYSKNGGGHCRGGAYGGCCRTFRTDTAGDAHRIGPYEPRGARRCLTVTEMLEREWRETDRGWTNAKPMTDEAKERLEIPLRPTKPFSAQGVTQLPASPENAAKVPPWPGKRLPGGHGLRFGPWRGKSNKD